MYVDRLKGNSLELCFPVVFDSSISFIHPFVFFILLLSIRSRQNVDRTQCDQIWRNIQSLGQFLWGYLLFAKFLDLLLQILFAIGKIFVGEYV